VGKEGHVGGGPYKRNGSGTFILATGKGEKKIEGGFRNGCGNEKNTTVWVTYIGGMKREGENRFATIYCKNVFEKKRGKREEGWNTGGATSTC